MFVEKVPCESKRMYMNEKKRGGGGGCSFVIFVYCILTGHF